VVVVDEDEKAARKGKSKVDPLVLVSVHLTPRTKTKPGARASTTRTNPKAVVFGPTGIPRSVFDNLDRAGLKSLIFDITAIATSDLSLRESDVMYKYATDSKATLQDTDAIQTLSAIMALSRPLRELLARDTVPFEFTNDHRQRGVFAAVRREAPLQLDERPARLPINHVQ
jgi:hypothetical protein